MAVAGSHCLTEEPEFAPKAVHVLLAVDILTLLQVFLRVFQSFSMSVIPPTCHVHSCIAVGWTVGLVEAAVAYRQSYLLATSLK